MRIRRGTRHRICAQTRSMTGTAFCRDRLARIGRRPARATSSILCKPTRTSTLCSRRDRAGTSSAWSRRTLLRCILCSYPKRSLRVKAHSWRETKCVYSSELGRRHKASTSENGSRKSGNPQSNSRSPSRSKSSPFGKSRTKVSKSIFRS